MIDIVICGNPWDALRGCCCYSKAMLVLL